MSEHGAEEGAPDGEANAAPVPIHWRPGSEPDNRAPAVEEPLRARDPSHDDPTTEGGNPMAKKKKDKKKKGKKGKKK